jgi:hypothetical protein
MQDSLSHCEKKISNFSFFRAFLVDIVRDISNLPPPTTKLLNNQLRS